MYGYASRVSSEPTVLLVRELEGVCTIRQAVKMLQRLARHDGTEAMAARIADAVYAHGLHAAAVARLSALHRRYGRELGIRGYAITVLWSCVVGAMARDRWVLLPEEYASRFVLARR